MPSDPSITIGAFEIEIEINYANVIKGNDHVHQVMRFSLNCCIFCITFTVVFLPILQ